MSFNATLKVDFAQWKNVRMERENNMRVMNTNDEEMPKFGAGSEYMREQKEELRRKKLGIIAKKYKQGKHHYFGSVSVFSQSSTFIKNSFYIYLTKRGTAMDVKSWW